MGSIGNGQALGVTKRRGAGPIGAVAALVAATLAMSLWAAGCAWAPRAWAAEGPAGLPETASGTCYIGSTWMVGSTSFFTIPSFSGTLEGCVPYGMFECLNRTAAAPHDVYADYWAELVEYNTSEGWARYYVTITPPDATDGETWNEYGLVGYQRVGGTVTITWNFNGGISLEKRSSNPSLTDGNSCYRLEGATYGVFETRGAAESRRSDRAAATFSTDAQGSWTSGERFAPGKYYIAELAAPMGYVLDSSIYEVAVEPGATARVNAGAGHVVDVPQTNPVTLWASKADSQTPDGSPQGNGTLAGAQFTIRYYDGYYGLGSLPAAPTRTWVVATGDDGVAVADDAHLVGGDPYYRTGAGQVTIPLGTVTIQETAAPHGYLIGDRSGVGETKLFQIRGDTEAVNVYSAPTFGDAIARGGVAIGKIDRQNGSGLPQGSASLAGAQFSIENASERAVIVDGAVFQPGEIVKLLECSQAGNAVEAWTSADCLPAGSYVVRECAAADGYLYDDASRSWSCSFEVAYDGQVVDLRDGAAASNRVVRGDIAFSKVDGYSMARLGKVPFLVTSTTTGESHVAVTDENGMLSTAASWNAHTAKTNANDAALVKRDGALAVDDERIDPSAGIWFDGRSDASCPPDDSLGALPYDTYTVAELRCAANEGYDLASFAVTIERDGRELDLGTVDDNPGPIVNTSLTDGNGVRLIAANTTATVTDTVSYVNLDMRKSYTMRGTMHLVGADGNDEGVIAESAVTFEPSGAAGTIGVDFAIDTADMEGARLVAFEQLEDSGGNVIASHEDLTYEGQTVRVPGIATELADASDGGHRASAEEAVVLVDNVSYRGLTPGEAYTVTGTLHLRGADGADEGIALDRYGTPLRAQTSFVPDGSEGTAQVTFAFAAPDLAGRSVVAFEELTRRGATYATHADIADEGQTVTFEPKPEEPVPPEEPAPPEEPLPPEEPKPETPVAVVQEVKPAPPAPPTTMAKTGDLIPLPLVVFVGAGALGLGGAALAVRRLERRAQITIRRGPRR